MIILFTFTRKKSRSLLSHVVLAYNENRIVFTLIRLINRSGSVINVIAVFLSVMPGSALSSLQLELRRGFESLKAAKGAFDGGHAECLELVCSLGNLALQLKALKQVQISETPLSGFPCLQQRLHYKLSLAVDALLAKLAEKM